MREVIYFASISVDGYIDAADGDSSWVVPDPELHRHFNELESSVDTHLYGRRMYELMAEFWPTAHVQAVGLAVDLRAHGPGCLDEADIALDRRRAHAMDVDTARVGAERTQRDEITG